METAFALGTLIFPTLRLIHDGVKEANGNSMPCLAACSLLMHCTLVGRRRGLRRPGSGALRHVGWRQLLFAFFATAQRRP